jgi:hypothetical protein
MCVYKKLQVNKATIDALNERGVQVYRDAHAWQYYRRCVVDGRPTVIHTWCTYTVYTARDQDDMMSTPTLAVKLRRWCDLLLLAPISANVSRRRTRLIFGKLADTFSIVDWYVQITARVNTAVLGHGQDM